MPRRILRARAEIQALSPYRRSVVSQKLSNRWERFSPASLVPFGGFGDPQVTNLVWRPPRNFDPDKLEIAKAQDRLARSLRVHMKDLQLTEGELERLLGYKRGYLVRKLNGIEAITMRDVVRIGKAFGSSVIGALAVDKPEFATPEGRARRRSASPPR